MNKHSVKFVRGSKTIWDQLNTTPEKIDNNTLYFIYEDENYSVGKLYLGQRLITDDKIINIKDIGDIQIEDESLIDKQILIYNEESQEWKNSSLEEIIDLSNYYTKNEVDNKINNIPIKMDFSPLNPTAEEIAVMSDGQLYSDTANHKGVIKGGQSFYDTVYIDENYRKTYKAQVLPPAKISRERINFFKKGERWIYTFYVDDHSQYNTYTLCDISLNPISDEVSLLWEKDHTSLHSSVFPEEIQMVDYTAQGIPIGTLPCVPSFESGDMVISTDPETGNPNYIDVCTGVEIDANQYVPSWASAITVHSIDNFLDFKEDTANKSNDFSMITTPVMEEDELFPTVGRMKAYINSNYYNTDQIDSMIGDIGTRLDQVRGVLNE